jgi:hypothetical protein
MAVRAKASAVFPAGSRAQVNSKRRAQKIYSRLFGPVVKFFHGAGFG